MTLMARDKEKKAYEKSIFQKRDDNLKKWVSFWRLNPHRFVEEYLGISLFFFQKILIYLMSVTPMFAFIASRGLGKSFLTAVYAVTRCILYPGTNVLIASETKSQAMLIITSKVMDLYNRSEALRAEISKITTGSNDASVVFKNGSEIHTSTTSYARGRRANVLIVDEFAQIEEDVYYNTLFPIANVARIPEFKAKNQKKYEYYHEENIQILMTSAWYKSHWSWKHFSSSLDGMLDNGPEKSVAVAIPYQVAIMHDILSETIIQNRLSNNDRFGFMKEYEAVFIGENENAYYSFDLLNDRRVIDKSFLPPTDIEYVTNQKLAHPKNITNMPRQDNEVRFVALDVAMSGGKDNDNSAFTCMRLVPTKNNEYQKQVVYIETIGDAITAPELAIRLKQLYHDFEADYAVLDTRNVGLNIYDALADYLYDDVRDVEYEPWASINNKQHRARFKNKNSKRVLYTVDAGTDFNDKIITLLRTELMAGKISLLVDDVKREDVLSTKSTSNWLKLSPEEQQRILYPYQQTTALVNEMINLSYKYSNGGKISVQEPRNGTKDRFSSLAYVNYFAYEYEMSNKVKERQESFKPTNLSFNWKRKGRR